MTATKKSRIVNNQVHTNKQNNLIPKLHRKSIFEQGKRVKKSRFQRLLALLLAESGHKLYIKKKISILSEQIFFFHLFFH